MMKHDQFRTLSLLLVIATGLLHFGVSASSQVIVNAGSTYTQDFNTPDFNVEVDAAGTGVAPWSFTNNSTYTGWMRQVSVGGMPDRGDKDFIGETMNSNTTRFGNVGNGGSYPESKTDRSLMSLVTPGGEVSFGVVFQVSGTSIGSLSVSFTGEQWFRAPNSNTLRFEYKVLNSFSSETFMINDETGWAGVSSLDFTALKVGNNQKINGNFTGDSQFTTNQLNLSAPISLVDAANDGDYIAFRWRQVDVTGATHQPGLGIDDLSVSFVAIPEPSTYAVITGLLMFGFVIYRRKRAQHVA